MEKVSFGSLELPVSGSRSTADWSEVQILFQTAELSVILSYFLVELCHKFPFLASRSQQTGSLLHAVSVVFRDIVHDLFHFLLVELLSGLVDVNHRNSVLHSLLLYKHQRLTSFGVGVLGAPLGLFCTL
jgi:hypothetical protein